MPVEVRSVPGPQDPDALPVFGQAGPAVEDAGIEDDDETPGAPAGLGWPDDDAVGTPAHWLGGGDADEEPPPAAP